MAGKAHSLIASNNTSPHLIAQLSGECLHHAPPVNDLLMDYSQLSLACIMVNRITLSLRSYTSGLDLDFNTQIATDTHWSLPPIVSSTGSETLSYIPDSARKSEYSEVTLSRNGDHSYEHDPRRL